MLNIIITTNCNQNCPFCFVGKKNKKNEMSIDSFRKIIDWCKNNGIKQIRILGGEPFLHKNLCTFLDECHTKEISALLITNATVLVDKKILLHPIIHNYLINVSASNSPESREKLEKNLKFISLKKRIVLGMTLYNSKQDSNYIFELCNKYKINEIRFDIAQPNLKGNNIYIKPKCYEKMKDPIMKIIKKAEKSKIKVNLDCGISVSLPNIFSKEEIKYIENYCGLAYKFCSPAMDVFSDLSVSYCFPMRNLKINNILEHRFHEIRNIFFKKIEKYVDYDKDYQGSCIRNIINKKSGKI